MGAGPETGTVGTEPTGYSCRFGSAGGAAVTSGDRFTGTRCTTGTAEPADPGV
ncbi:hypothetical protein ACFWZ2_05245 [Streptomyces sp. NPDC059002]|uniref:hypothetical protein n=1 Tax=Streptomyces sp. NPDC059002 TaxID=3346690 RepID=UPI0036D0FAE2